MKHRLLFLISFLCLAVCIKAAEPTAQLEKANAAYQNNDFTTAIEQYEAILQQGYRSEALYYNLGNSYYRTKDFGKAVLNYERALLLNPNDADTQHNLQVVRSQLADEIDILPTFFLTRWWNGLGGLFSVKIWSILAVTLLWLGVGGLALWLLGRVRRYKKVGFIVGATMLIFSLLAFTLANSRTNVLTNSSRAVVLEKEVVLRSAPDQQSKEVFILHAGATVKLLDRIGNWHKVALLDGRQGWLPGTAFALI